MTIIESVIQTLKQAPKCWQALEERDAAFDEAVQILHRAGLIERRVVFRLCAPGRDTGVECTISGCGEVLAPDTFRGLLLEAEEVVGASTKFYGMFIGRGEWRINRMGEQAVIDSDDGDPQIPSSPAHYVNQYLAGIIHKEVVGLNVAASLRDCPAPTDALPFRDPVTMSYAVSEIRRINPKNSREDSPSTLKIELTNWSEGAKTFAEALSTQIFSSGIIPVAAKDGSSNTDHPDTDASATPDSSTSAQCDKIVVAGARITVCGGRANETRYIDAKNIVASCENVSMTKLRKFDKLAHEGRPAQQKGVTWTGPVCAAQTIRKDGTPSNRILHLYDMQTVRAFFGRIDDTKMSRYDAFLIPLNGNG